MEKKIVVFKNLYDTYNAMGLPVSQNLSSKDFTINNLKELHPQLPFKSVGYRPNYFSFLFVKKGEGKYTTDNQTFFTKPGTVYFTNPGHYKSFEWYELDEVYLITFTEFFLKENVHRDVFTEFPFLLSETVNPKILNANEFEEFEQIYLQIIQAYQSRSPFKQRIVGSLLVLILLKVKEYIWKDYCPIHEGNRSSQIVNSFKKDLEIHYSKIVQGKTDKIFRVQDFAELQSLHPNYLSNVIKSKTGKSISTWIAEKTIAEARSMLKNSSLSVKEIACLLGFKASAHFSNYFKKNTAETPAQYRKLVR